jgi:transcriptional regulator with XRE-family HTH domain
MLTNEKVTAFYQDVGNLIRTFRKLKDINQESLAEQLGISRISLVNIENGKQRVPLHVLIEVTNILKIPLKEVIPSFEKADDTIDPSILNRINKEAGRSPGSEEKAIDFFKAHVKK